MARTLVCWLGVAAALALQPAQAGEHKPPAVQGHHLGASIHTVGLVGPARSSLRGDVPKAIRYDVTSRRDDLGASRATLVHREFAFVPVTPFKADPPSPHDRGITARQGETGPSTSPRERKSITFFRLDPKLGDVSVQPVVGGVNGAQLSVGF